MLTTTELEDARGVALAGISLVANWFRQNPVPSGGQPVAVPARLQAAAGQITIRFGLAPGEYLDLSNLGGDSSVLINVPRGGELDSHLARPTPPPGVQRLTTAVAATVHHEVVHRIQQRQNPANWELAKARTLAFQSKNGTRLSNVPPMEWLNGYYSIPEEVEAHAEQLAAEVYFTVGPGRLAVFLSTANDTPVYRRLDARMCFSTMPDGPIQTWRTTWLNDAAHIYAAW